VPIPAERPSLFLYAYFFCLVLIQINIESLSRSAQPDTGDDADKAAQLNGWGALREQGLGYIPDASCVGIS
jgi:hypothetical protein